MLGAEQFRTEDSGQARDLKTEATSKRHEIGKHGTYLERYPFLAKRGEA